jgi:hypothetical protein
MYAVQEYGKAILLSNSITASGDWANISNR